MLDDASNVSVRPVRLFRNGRNQAVRIPREFELPGQEAVISKQGDALIIRPAPQRSLLRWLEHAEPIDDALPPVADAPPEPVNL